MIYALILSLLWLIRRIIIRNYKLQMQDKQTQTIIYYIVLFMIEKEYERIKKIIISIEHQDIEE